MSEKNYISTFIKEREGKYGKFLTVSMKLEELQKLPVDKYGNVKVIIQERKEPDKWGNTHSMVEDTYKPKAQEPDKAKELADSQECGLSNSQECGDGLPF
jgi:hypothetical protein